VSGRSVRVSASIGIAVSSTGYTRAGEVVRDAATALHRAELLGGKRCEVFDTAVLQLAQAELQLETDLAGALERGEFALFYQPIVSLASSQIVGFEALLRWQHPVLGMILPLEFVPIAEQSGVIVPLGNWVLREACRQLKEWQDGTPSAEHLWVSVNLSAVQLAHQRLVEEIGDALSESGLEPRCLLLELTEGMAMENPTEAQTLLMQIRALGVRVSVDDFGTGHSALAYLRQFPLDSLKVDRSFVRGIESNPDMASILGAVTTMTRQLGLQMVAEGIEKDEQLELVRSLDCEYGQGFLFSKPVAPDRAASMVRDGLPPRPAMAAASVAHGPANRRHLWTTRNLLAAAAVAAVIASVGLPRYFAEDPVPVPEPTAGARRDADIPLSPPVEPGDVPATPLEPAGVVARSGSTGAPPESAAPLPARPDVMALAGLLTSIRVVHQHRLGSCRGMLIVSRDGLAFVPDDAPDQAKDGFNLLHDQFLHALDGDSLTVRSAQRAYRFRSDEQGGSQRLGALVESIARIRKNP
jgi:EAL domain-containing protein (putative c-di-GMP-specific phosphodiesterase class I)